MPLFLKSPSEGKGGRRLRRAMLPTGLELSRSAEAGGAPPTLAPDCDQDKPLADSAEWAGQPVDCPHRRASGANLSERPPSRLQRVVGRPDVSIDCWRRECAWRSPPLAPIGTEVGR
jgi:hypothetical protein